MMYVLEEIVRVWLSMTQMGGGMRIPQSVRISLSSEMDMGIDETTVKPLSINCRTKGVLEAEVKELIVKNLFSQVERGWIREVQFGIFRAEGPDNCLGVDVYGYMKNPKANLFTHPNPKAWICELIVCG